MGSRPLTVAMACHALFALLLVSASALIGADKVLPCYYASYAVYRNGDGNYAPVDIDPSLCTHMIYAFAKFGPDSSLQPADAFADTCANYGKCGYKNFNALKQKNPKLVTLLSIGGFNLGSAVFSQMANAPPRRTTFVKSAVKLLQQYDFSGLDMSWEYPGSRGGAPYDQTNFVTLLKELKTKFDAANLTLTATVAGVKSLIDPGYPDGKAITDTVDLMMVMSYCFHGSWEVMTNHQSLLYAYPKNDDLLNQNYTLHYWMQRGAAPDKMVMILPAVADCWTLDDPAKHGMFAPARNPSAAGPYLYAAGTLGYNEICTIGKSNTWTVVRDPNMNEPYAYNTAYKNAWCGYEDPTSVALKAKYATQLGLAGVAVWSIDTDDFHANCGGASMPLVKALGAALDLSA